MTRYDSDSAEAGSEEFSSRSHGRRRRSPSANPLSAHHLPVHTHGMYRADGLLSPDVKSTGTSPSTLGRSLLSQCRELPGMYDPEMHVLPGSITKEQRCSDSVSSQPDYVQRVASRPGSRIEPGGWTCTESSSASQDLYLRSDRGKFRRSFCGVCFTISIVLVIAAVISVAAISAYLGMKTVDDGLASKYEMAYKGEFQVSRGDFFYDSLTNKTSQDFLLKAEQYGRLLDSVYSSSYLANAFRRVQVESFSAEPFTVKFLLHLDRRRVPSSVLDTERAVSDVITQEVMSVEPRAFRDVLIDIDSIRVTRDNAKFENLPENSDTRSQVSSDGHNDAASLNIPVKSTAQTSTQIPSLHEVFQTTSFEFVTKAISLSDSESSPRERQSVDSAGPEEVTEATSRAPLHPPSQHVPPMVRSDIQKRVLLTESSDTSGGLFKLTDHARGMTHPQPLAEFNTHPEMKLSSARDSEQGLSEDSPTVANTGPTSHSPPAGNRLSDALERETAEPSAPVNQPAHHPGNSATLPDDSRPSLVNTEIDDALTETFNRMLLSNDAASAVPSNTLPQSQPSTGESYHVSSDLGALLAAGVPYGSVNRIGVVDDAREEKPGDFIEISVGSNYGPRTQSSEQRQYESLHEIFSPDSEKKNTQHELPFYDLSPWSPIVPLPNSESSAASVPANSARETLLATHSARLEEVNSSASPPVSTTLSPHIIYADTLDGKLMEDTDESDLVMTVQANESVVDLSPDKAAHPANPVVRPILSHSAISAPPTDGFFHSRVDTIGSSLHQDLRRTVLRHPVSRTPVPRPTAKGGFVAAGQKLIELLGTFIGTSTAQRSRSSSDIDGVTGTTSTATSVASFSTETTITPEASPETETVTPSTSTLPPIKSYSGVRATLRERPKSSVPIRIENKHIANISATMPSEVEDQKSAENPPDVDEGNSTVQTEDYRSLLRLMSLKFPGLMANSSSEGIANIFSGANKTLRVPQSSGAVDPDLELLSSRGEQRGNTKFLRLVDVGVDGASSVSGVANANDPVAASRTKRSEKPVPQGVSLSLLDVIARVTRADVSAVSVRRSQSHERLLSLTAFPTEPSKRLSLLHGHNSHVSIVSPSFRESKGELAGHRLNTSNEQASASDKNLQMAADGVESASSPHLALLPTAERTGPSALRHTKSRSEADKSISVENSSRLQHMIALKNHRMPNDTQSNYLQSGNLADDCGEGRARCSGVAGRCLPQSALCDGVEDCPGGTDELQCVALADGATGSSRDFLTIDASPAPEGVVRVQRRGRWGELCVEQSGTGRNSTPSRQHQSVAEAVCKYLAYRNVESVSVIGGQEDQLTYEKTYFKVADVPSLVESDMLRRTLQQVTVSGDCSRGVRLKVRCGPEECGLRSMSQRREARIVGGADVSSGQSPWLASLYRRGQLTCGATLISSRWLVSAAHCFAGWPVDQWTVRLGAAGRHLTSSASHELHKLSHVIVHPEYRQFSFDNDLVLLRLQQPARRSVQVRPACLAEADSVIRPGRLCTVLGWGQLNETGHTFPDTLQEVQLPLISSRDCRKRSASVQLYRVTERMFCAGYEQGGRDTCLGDSGGPLLCQEEDGRWEVTGVTSNGFGCARRGRPGIYTKVASYRHWIDQIMSGPLPTTPLQRPCTGFRCLSGECLSVTARCDGKSQCADSTDEHNCYL